MNKTPQKLMLLSEVVKSDIKNHLPTFTKVKSKSMIQFIVKDFFTLDLTDTFPLKIKNSNRYSFVNF